MDIHRHQPCVDFFTYETKSKTDEKENQIKLSLVYLDEKKLADNQWKTSLGVRVEFAFATDEFFVVGKVSQIDDIRNRRFEKVEDFTWEEIEQLLIPLLHLVENMVYDISEVALDKPGVVIDFSKMKAMDPADIEGHFEKRKEGHHDEGLRL